MIRHGFRAMGTDVTFFVDAEAANVAVGAAEREFHRLESLLSRFRPESELSRLNAEGDLVAGPDLLRVVELALAARERTRGRFDPTVHRALVAAGYDRTFADVEPDGDEVDVPPAAAGGGVTIQGPTISLAPGIRLDLGGIGKGYAAERAAEMLATAGPCLVDAGGDIATRGGPWPVGVETAGGTLTLELRDGALATSGRDRRRWRRGGRELHHLIDPATGRPSASDVLRVTVFAPDAIAAEVHAKSLFLAGSARAVAEATLDAIPAVIVTTDGHTVFAGGIG